MRMLAIISGLTLCCMMCSCATLASKSEVSQIIDDRVNTLREELKSEIAQQDQALAKLSRELNSDMETIHNDMSKLRSDLKHGSMRMEESARSMEKIDGQLRDFYGKFTEYLGLKSVALDAETEAVNNLLENLENAE